MTPHFVPYDAIGNDIRGMAEHLQRNGYRVNIYAEGIHSALNGTAEILDLRRHSFWLDRDVLLIYHHSMGWPLGETVLSQARCHVAIKHHNVTPPVFFQPYSEDYTVACKAGQLATSTIARTPDAKFWVDSQFNAENLIDNGVQSANCYVLPPFHWTERLAEAPLALDIVQSCKRLDTTIFLFVGGIKPNKGHARLIQALATYVSQINDAVLILPGGSDPRLANYVAGLRTLAVQLGVASKIIFAGTVSDSQLRAYYFCADAFLCLSEHEGFCVPLLEAMRFRVPVVAHACTAIPETLGEAALIWDKGDLASIVESLAICAEHDDHRRALAEAGCQRYIHHYAPARIEDKFISLVEEAIEA